LLEVEKRSSADLGLQVRNLQERLGKSLQDAVLSGERAKDEEMKENERKKLKQELIEMKILIQNLQEECKSKTDDLISHTAVVKEKDLELLKQTQLLQDMQREKSSVNIDEIIQNKLLEAESKFSAEKKEIKREFDAKIIELLEIENKKFDSQISILRSEHAALIEEEKRRVQEGVQMSRSVSEKESASREQSATALKAQFEGKMQASDAQMLALKQQLNRSECSAVQCCHVMQCCCALFVAQYHWAASFTDTALVCTIIFRSFSYSLSPSLSLFLYALLSFIPSHSLPRPPYYTKIHHHTKLHDNALHYTTLNYTALNYTTLNYTTIHYTTPH
jgi:hypothetical protein